MIVYFVRSFQKFFSIASESLVSLAAKQIVPIFPYCALRICFFRSFVFFGCHLKIQSVFVLIKTKSALKF